MKKLLLSTLFLLGGACTGAAGAVLTNVVLADRKAQSEKATVFVATGPILAPLVFADGRLSGYVTIEAQLEVASDQGENVQKRLPLLLDAVNMRTVRAPMASGPDGMIPGLEVFRHVLFDAACDTFGKAIIRRVVVTRAIPA